MCNETKLLVNGPEIVQYNNIDLCGVMFNYINRQRVNKYS